MPERCESIYIEPFINALRAEYERTQPKPHAFDTPFRHSEGGACALKLAMQYQGVPASDPFDPPSLWVSWLGTTAGEAWAKAWVGYFPNARPEHPVHDPEMLASGSLDLLVPFTAITELPDKRSTTAELKTVNGSKFRRAIGVYHRGPGSRWQTPKGPAASHVIQLALNTIAAESRVGVLLYLSTEAVSKGVAKVLGMSDKDRFTAEWVYSREELEPIAAAELERLREIKEFVDSTHDSSLVRPEVINDSFEREILDPIGSDVLPWQCEYCSHYSICPAANIF
jgi:hypothetical protein